MPQIRHILGELKEKEIKHSFHNAKSVEVPKRLKNKKMRYSNYNQMAEEEIKFVMQRDGISRNEAIKKIGLPVPDPDATLMQKAGQFVQSFGGLDGLFGKAKTVFSGQGQQPAPVVVADDPEKKVLGMSPVLGYTVIAVVVLILIYVTIKLIQRARG